LDECKLPTSEFFNEVPVELLRQAAKTLRVQDLKIWLYFKITFSQVSMIIYFGSEPILKKQFTPMNYCYEIKAFLLLTSTPIT
jgi:hypothetical protein